MPLLYIGMNSQPVFGALREASDDPLDGDVGIFAQQVDVSLLAGLSLGPNDDRGAVHHPVGRALGFDLVGDDRIVHPE